MMCRLGLVQQIAVDVVLEDEPRRIEPVVEDLAAHDVPSHAPAVLISRMTQPVVPEHLGVEVVRLEGRVVHVVLGSLEEEEAVVVYELVSAVQAEEGRDVDLLVVVYQLQSGRQFSPRGRVSTAKTDGIVLTSLGKKSK